MSIPPAIMVTAVGALIGQGILRSLHQTPSGYRLIGLDRAQNAYGASLCDVCYQKPYPESDPAFLPWLQDVIERENIRLVLPGIEEDVFFFHDHRQDMEGWPAHVVLNSSAAIEAGRDKWRLHQTLVEHGLPVIPTTTAAAWREVLQTLGNPPFITKLRRGSGSRGQQIIQTEADWEEHRAKGADGFMVQKLIGSDDEEYTVGLFGYGDGTSSNLIILRRKLWNGGTWQAELVHVDDAVAVFCTELTRVFKPIGPTNYQFRRDGEQWLLLEINPRISAATAMRCGFGFNEAGLCVQHWLQDQQRPQPSALRSGTCQRYVTEHFDFA